MNSQSLSPPQSTLNLTSGQAADSANEFHWRALSSLGVFRLFIGVMLMAVFLSSDSPRFFGEENPTLFLLTLLIWFAFAVIGAVACSRRSIAVEFLTQLQLLFDIAAIVTLMLASGGISSGIAGLLIIYVGAGSFILRGILPVFFAALATIGLLSVQLFLYISGSGRLLDLPSAGLMSAVIFVVALAMRPLANRLAQSEALARQQVIDIANLAELNRYVVQHLRESIVVIDNKDNVRLINDAAAHQLGVERTQSLGDLRELAPEVADLVARWREQGSLPTGERLTAANESGERLQVHIAPFGEVAGTDAPLLLFLEDVSALAERVQQSKLASLGRLSASIAHEVRNPVGAMSHAAQLLAESHTDEASQKLTGIIQRNATRISTLVDDILNMSRRDSSRPEKIILGQWLADFAHEFCATFELPEGGLQLIGEEAITEIRFDPNHLRQIMWNLCENACKHGEANEHSPITIGWGRSQGSRRPYLEIRDSGPGIDDEFTDRIFEPFFTRTDSGTGLGLFIARELCELNRATLSYRQGENNTGSILHIVLADPARWSGIR